MDIFNPIKILQFRNSQYPYWSIIGTTPSAAGAVYSYHFIDFRPILITHIDLSEDSFFLKDPLRRNLKSIVRFLTLFMETENLPCIFIYLIIIIISYAVAQ